MEETRKYFDWAATAPQDKEVIRECLETSFKYFANPSSPHSLGKKAKQKLEEARTLCAEVLSVPPSTLFFTSGGTESDQIPILSLLQKPIRGSVVVSETEHPAISRQVLMLKKYGFEIISVKPNKEGRITKDAIKQKLKNDTLLVLVMLVNNETGAVSHIEEIAHLLEKEYEGKRKPLLMVDCVQATGKIPFDIETLGCDFASFCAHKIMGPRGVGLLYCKKPLDSFLKGGGQENDVRSGTQNLFGALCLSKLLEKYHISKENQLSQKRYEEQKKNTAFFIEALKNINKNDLPLCTLVPQERGKIPQGTDDGFSPYIVQASFKNIPGLVMVRALDEKGFCISTGSACSSSKNSRPVLEAMNVPPSILQNAVRISFGPDTTLDDMKDLLVAIKEVALDFC